MTVYVVHIGKFIIAIVYDFLDFFIGKIPGIKELWDIFGMLLAIIMWGPVGVAAIWEAFDVTGLLASEIPTLTLVGIVATATQGRR